MQSQGYPNTTQSWSDDAEMIGAGAVGSPVDPELTVPWHPLVRHYADVSEEPRPLGSQVILSDVRELAEASIHADLQLEVGLPEVLFRVEDDVCEASADPQRKLGNVFVVKTIAFKWNGRCAPDDGLQGVPNPLKKVPVIVVLPLFKKVQVNGLRDLLAEHFPVSNGAASKKNGGGGPGKVSMCPEKDLVPEFGQLRGCVGPLGVR
eukprot:scaffold1149_cov236-Pinguiococcus_pyrenoidosus.AAC.7